MAQVAPAQVEQIETPEPVQETIEYPKLQTAGFDARFPNCNQTKNCWQNYVDYFKCVRAKGEDYPPCKQFQRAYHSLCPPLWKDRWDEQRENNVFPPLVEKQHGDDHH